MAELGIPWAQRKLARPSPGGGGGGGAGGIAQPRIPDVSGMYAPLRGIGQELGEAADVLGQMAERQQKAQDLGKVTAAKGALDEQLGYLYNDITGDASIDPGTYRERFNAGRQAIMDEIGKTLPSRLKGPWAGAAATVSGDLAVKIDAEGHKRGIEQGLEALDLRASQLRRQIVAEPHAGRREILSNEMRDLYQEYKDRGIMSPSAAATGLQKQRDQIGVDAWDSFVRTDTDTAVDQLERGYSTDMSLSPEAYPKMLDKARDVQRERYTFREKREADTRADTERAQKQQEATGWGLIRDGQMPRATLDRWRDDRQISPAGYESMVRYQDTKNRENRALGLQARALAQADSERKLREKDAELSIAAMTGAMTTEQIVAYGQTNRLNPRALDTAVGKSLQRTQALEGQYGRELTQAEQRLRARFGTPGPFDKFEDEKLKDFYANALDELSGRSRAYGGQENALDIVDEIAVKHQTLYALEQAGRMDEQKALLEFQTPDALEAAKLTLPAWKFEQQRRLFRQIGEAQNSIDKATAKPPSDRKPGWGTK